jgi:hypothetical protein
MDADADGLSDFCERNLAQAFAPELSFWMYDEVARDPYWVAGPGQDDERVVLGYLPAYFRDAGSQTYICSLPPPTHDPSCDGHNGDSEVVFVVVRYHWSIQHWVVEEIRLSQHGSFEVHGPSGGKIYPKWFTYPERLGATSPCGLLMASTLTTSPTLPAMAADSSAPIRVMSRAGWSAFWRRNGRTSDRVRRRSLIA